MWTYPATCHELWHCPCGLLDWRTGRHCQGQPSFLCQVTFTSSLGKKISEEGLAICISHFSRDGSRYFTSQVSYKRALTGSHRTDLANRTQIVPAADVCLSATFSQNKIEVADAIDSAMCDQSCQLRFDRILSTRCQHVRGLCAGLHLQTCCNCPVAEGLHVSLQEGVTGFHAGRFNPDKLDPRDASALAQTIRR